jgi:hypothetical protein
MTDKQIETAGIAVALAKAQMQMGKAFKTSENPHFKRNYADLSVVMEACLPALNENGIAVIQPMIVVEGDRFIETQFIHGQSGQTLACSIPLIVSKNDMQALGSAMTYARRYGLMAMAGIAPEDDDGTAAAASAKAISEEAKAKEAVVVAKRIDAGKQSILEAETLEELGETWKLFTKESRFALIEEKDARKQQIIDEGMAETAASVDLNDEGAP